MRGRRFDDRAIDFHTGRRVSPPMEDRKLCACCGRRLVKGWITPEGDPLGDECEDILARAETAYRCGYAADVTQFVAQRQKQGMGGLQSSVMRYLAANVFKSERE